MISIAKPVLGHEEIDAVKQVLASGQITQGRLTKELEQRFANLCDSNFAVALNNGTAALHTALYALGIGKGDEVIVPPFTFVATANAVLMQQASLVFADVEDETFNLDPGQVEKHITPRTKAIIAVNLYGHPADYDSLRALADKHDLFIIEDAAQSHGALYHGRPAGSLGDIAAFSFYATKNMMCAEGGIITTTKDDWAEKCRRFRHHGQSEQTRYEYDDLGYNYRMNDIQAAIALEQLKRLHDMNEKRILNARALTRGLGHVDHIQTPVVREGVRHVYHQYTILVEKHRDALLNHLRDNGVGAGVYYPKPLHLHPHFRKLGFSEGDFPVSELLSTKVISLPVHPSVSEKDIEKIISVVKSGVKA